MTWSGRSLLLMSALAISGGEVCAQQPTRSSPAPTNSPVTSAEPQLPTAADVAVDVLQAGNSSKAMRETARNSVPLQQLTPDRQKLARAVLDDISLFRRLPSVRATLDPRVYNYFLEAPDAAVSIWRVLGISKLQLNQTSPGVYQADTGDGSTGTVQLFLRTPNVCMVYCDGLFKSPVMARPIKARALLVLYSSTQQQPDGTYSITQTADMFVNFPSLAVETIARMVSPLSYKYADRNIEEITSFLRMMDVSMARQPTWIEQIALLMDGVSQEHTTRLRQLTSAVHIDARRRNLQGQTNALPIGGSSEPVQKVSGITDGVTK